MKITFYGASSEVTGSCFHLQFSDGTEILVDAGYFQGGEKDLTRNDQKLPVDWSKIKYIALTHSHLDHCGRLPIFYKQGFRGRIIATAPSRDIAEIVWRDNVHLLETASNLANTDPFFTEEDINACLRLFDTVDYENRIKLSGDVSVTLVDAGHILGSSSVKIHDRGEIYVFSGDIGNWPMDAVRVTVHPGEADMVVMESTYGNRLHEPKEQEATKLQAAIEEIIKQKSTLLVPAFAIERTQELLRDLDVLVESDKIPDLPVFLDSPMAERVTALFGKYQKFLPDELQTLYKQGNDPFSFPKFKNCPTAVESKAINVVQGPKIIVAGSGMMTGGRVVHHLKRVLPDPRSVLLIVGYQVKGTLGREIQDGAKEVRVDGRTVPVRCKIEEDKAYSAHADQKQLLEWLVKFNPHPTKVFLTHGDPDAIATFSDLVTSRLNIKPAVPTANQMFEL